VLCLDADEMPSAKMFCKLQSFLENTALNRPYNGISVRYRSLLSGRWIRHGDWGGKVRPILYRRGFSQWTDGWQGLYLAAETGLYALTRYLKAKALTKNQRSSLQEYNKRLKQIDQLALRREAELARSWNFSLSSVLGRNLRQFFKAWRAEGAINSVWDRYFYSLLDAFITFKALMLTHEKRSLNSRSESQH
jgi:transposase